MRKKYMNTCYSKLSQTFCTGGSPRKFGKIVTPKIYILYIFMWILTTMNALKISDKKKIRFLTVVINLGEPVS